MQSVDVQSVVYMNNAEDLVRAAEAVANAAGFARRAGLLDRWMLRLGDCGPEQSLSDLKQDHIRRMVVAENGDFSYEVFGANLGSAAGHNRLASQGNYDQLLIMNPDALASYNLLDVMLATASDSIGFVEARQLPFEHPKDYDSVTGKTGWGSTACAMIPRSLFEKLNGFDADTFFLYCDDVDFSWRVRLAGKDVVYQPAARVFHDKRLTSNGGWDPSDPERFYSAEAALLLAYKYSREDVLGKTLEMFEQSDDKHIQAARTAFEERRQKGSLPPQIDQNHKVASFAGGNYTVHRF